MKKQLNPAFVVIVTILVLWSTAAGSTEIWVEPNSFDLNTVEGCILTQNLTIGNNGTEDLNFTIRSRETSRQILSDASSCIIKMATTKTTKNKIVLEYNFNEPVITKKKGYDLAQIEGLELYERTGAPVVPVRPVRVLVPFGKRVISTRVTTLASRELPETYMLLPGQEPYPLSYQGPVKFTEPDSFIYGQSTPWPGKDHEQVGSQSKRGYELFTVNLFPLQYIPDTGKLIYSSKLQLKIDLADSKPKKGPKPTKRLKAALTRMVDNPNVLSTYSEQDSSVEQLNGAALPGGGPYEYVIITSSALESAAGPWNFQALRDAKIAKGMTATIVTTDWIYSNYDGTRPDGGSDNQTRIRNFLIDAYQTWGTEYVLLGGTNSIVPARKFWVESWPGGDIARMPVDMYYGCVDPEECTFDYDEDGEYGEPTDGVGGGDVDLYAEIYVGRAAVENATELQNFIQKTLVYSSTYSEYLKQITMVGEHLGFGGVAEYAKPSMEQIRLGGDYDGYFTYGFENHPQPDFYDFDTSTNLYDADGYWSKSSLINLMNAGTHLFNHLGHANYIYDMKLYTSDLSSLTNTDYFFAYSQGCNPGGFDTTNCFAEVITSMEYGAFAVVMNARYGWGTHYSTDGPSQRFARQFWDAALSEDMLELGRANQDSKEDNLWDINGSCIRWCYYELNLFGDPEQQLRFEEACEWITFEPEAGIVEPEDSNEVSITFDAMELAPGIYEAEIVIVSNDPNSPTTVPVTMTVNMDDLQVAPAEGFESTGTEGGPFEPKCKLYTLTNINGMESVSWTTSETENWLYVDPNGGILDPYESIDVNICISPEADLLDPNLYTETLMFQNIDSNSIKPRSITLTVKPADCFAESFTEEGSDLEGVMLTLSPDGSAAYYEVCSDRVDEFPTDPNGGTYVALWDDDFAEVFLGGPGPVKKILFYDTWYNRFYIGSNGYITFGDGDTEFSGSLQDHFNIPRISGLFTDLTPPDGQCISYKELGGRIAVTFEDVHVFGDKDAKNSFQIEMFFVDGTIRITWLKVADTACVAGLSRGRGIPPVFFEESDLNKYLPCWPLGDCSRDYTVNFMDFAVLASHWLDFDCNIPYWCGRTDFDFSGSVDEFDLDIFSENWLVTNYWWLEPIAHWKLDEGSGDIAYDSTGDNDGTLVGDTSWTTGQIDGALLFDGYGDYVEGSSSPFDFEDMTFTVTTWINTTSTEDKLIITEIGYGGWMLRLLSSGGIGFTLKEPVQSSDAYSANTTGIVCNDGTWHFIAAVVTTDTVSSTGNNADIYIDGNKASVTENIVYPYGGSDYNWMIAARSINPSYFEGLIDDVRIYDRALSSEEIEELYHQGIGKKAFNPNPTDGATNVDPNTVLSWTPGYGAISHDVYLGTDYNDVNDANRSSAEYKGNFDVSSFDPNGLELETTYYWRIDELDGSNTYKGNIWSFTTWAEPNSCLVSWWKFDEGSGNTAYDSVGDNDGTLSDDTSWTMGQIDGALLFDGDGDYVSLAENAVTTTEFTVSAWANHYGPGGGENNRNMIFCQRDDAMGDNYCAIEFATEGSYDNVAATIRSSSGSMQTLSYAKKDYNQWHHYSMTVSSSDLILYIDGIEVDRTSNNQVGDYVTSIDYVDIGRQRYTGGYKGFFNGVIDDVRIYDRALSSEEIEELYRQGISNKASNPNPTDGATNVDPNTVLSWMPGYDAISHDVYLGTDYDDVNDANRSSDEYKGNFDINSFDPNGLEHETTYYWRVDEVNDLNIWKGDVWNFTTRAESEPNFVSWWKFDEGSGSIAYDSTGGNNGTLVGDTGWTAGQIDGALLFDGDGDYVSLAENAVKTTEFTVAAWANHYGPGGGENNRNMILCQRDDEMGNNRCAIEFATEGSYDNAVATIRSSSGSMQALSYAKKDYNQWHHYAMTVDSDDFILYIDGAEVNRTSNNQAGDYITSIDYVDIGRQRYTGVNNGFFNGVIDDVRIYNRALSAEELWEIYEEGRVYKASNPNPTDGATNVDPNTVLSWTPGYEVISHDVYLGTDYDDVNDANRSSVEYMGNLDVNSFDPCGLEYETTYYWRVDEVNDLNIWKGDVWSFTTCTEFDPNTDLVGWWKFDEGSGDIAYDSAGDNDGTLVNDPCWTTGQINGALSFDGNDDYVEGSNSPFDFEDMTFTVTTWINTTSTEDKLIITEIGYGGWMLRLRSSGGIGFTLKEPVQSSDAYSANTTGIVCNDGSWHFIAGVVTTDTVSSTGNNADIYIDGNKASVTENIVYPYGGSDYNWMIAARSINPSYFDGIIDDVRVYDKGLSAEEIWQLYLNGLN